MQQELRDHVDEYKKNNRKKSLWRKIVQGLACCVVFCTTYALILPAITMKQETFCGQEEHVHTQECYVQDSLAAVLICPLEETEGKVIPTVSGNDAIVFEEGVVPGQEEGLAPGQVPHKHTAECYAVPTEFPLTCGLEENPEHTHNFLCYGTWHLVCEKEEHAHSLACFSNPEADVENATVWEQMIASVDLTGEWSEDMVSIAKKQMGYTESTLNYQVLEDGSLSGYTRYGAWSGTPYEEWNTIFVHFCISYAGVEGMPLTTDCQEWKAAFENAALYQTAQTYSPLAGEILFLDENADGLTDRVGIVVEVIAGTEEAPAQIKSIQGDVDKQVQYINYDLDDARILGYGRLPKQPAPVYQYADATVQVDVRLPEGTTVPRNAQLVVRAIEDDAAEYANLLEQAEATVEGDIAQIQFYDISFYSKKNEYIPFEDWAHVTMNFSEGVVEAVEEMVVLHYDEKEDAPVVLDNVSVAGEAVADTASCVLYKNAKAVTGTVVSFETNGFSTFAVVGVQAEKNPDMYELTITDAPTGTAYYESPRVFMIHTMEDAIDNAMDGGKDTRIALSSEVVTIHQNGAESQQLKGVEVLCEDGKILATANNHLLWEIALVEYGSTIYIRSVATGKYLYVDNAGNWGLSDTIQACRTENPDGSNRVIYNATNRSLAFLGLWECSDDNGTLFFKAWEINDTRSRVLLTEYIENEDIITDNTAYVTNLDGQVLAVIAVNNLVEEGIADQTLYYPALASTSNKNEELIGSDVYNVRVENESLIIGNEEDINNRIAWKFTDAGKAGSYYVQAANYFGTPNAGNTAGKYLNISATGISVSDTKQAIEVVEAVTYDDGGCSVRNNVVCLRAKVDGVYYTVQLNNNIGSWDFVSSGTVGSDANTTNNRANHFVLASLSDQADLDFMRRIDELPSREEFDAIVDAITGADGADTFAKQTAERERLRQLAMMAAEHYFGTEEYTSDSVCALSDVQKNFIGKERIEKFLALEWLWRNDPNVVPAAAPNVIVKLFNYSGDINSYYFDNDPAKKMGFYCYDSDDKIVDESRIPANGESWAPVMSPVLGENGYPVIKRIPVTYTNPETGDTTTYWVDVENGELAYLFNAQHQKAVMSAGGGLFQKDDRGYYYYFSDMNAAWYNSDANAFELYDVVVRPEYTRLKYNSQNGETNDSRSNFLPFDEVVGNIIYDDEALFGPGENSLGDDQNTVKTRYDDYGMIETQTAYLNDPTDLWFGMSLDYNFFIPTDAVVVNNINGQEVREDMIFEFHGDDDVFVYIDDVLILNIGGAHAARSGSINFRTGAVSYQTDLDTNSDGVPEEGTYDVNTTIRALFREAMRAQSPNGVVDEAQLEVLFDGETLADNTMHNLKFFYVERGGTYSYAGIKFNMPTIPENSLIVGKELTNDENVIDAGQTYSFRIVNAENPNEIYIGQGTSFILYEDGEMIGNGTVGANGIFTLKANQQALFAGILDASRENKTFIVQELIPTNIDGQYRVSYSDDASSNNPVLNPYTENGMTIYSSATYSVDGIAATYTKNVTFTNEVATGNLDTLKITKEAGEDTVISDSEVFDINVQVAADRNAVLIPIPVGTKYTVNSEERSVVTEGIIPLKVNETAIITGFLSGTYWTVDEVNVTTYTPKYKGEAEKGVIEASGNAGTFGLADTVKFTVTNYSGASLINIPISKQAEGNDTRHTFDFVAELGHWDWNGNWTKYRDLNIGKITVTDDTVTLGSIPVNLKDTDAGSNIYIKVWERNDGGTYIYDETFYLVQFAINEENGKPQLNGAFRHGDGSWVTTENPLPFVNQKINGFTVSKEVVNTSDPTDVGGTFSFEATVTMNGNPYTEIPTAADDRYRVENGKVYFDLKHNESLTLPIPEGAVVTVTETSITGYTTSHQIIQGTQAPGAMISGATTGEITMGADGIEVHYINRTGYELPETGGNVTNIYHWGSLLMLFACAGLFLLGLRRKSS